MTLPPFSNGLPSFTSAPWPTRSTSPNSTVAPGSASSFSTRSTPSFVTRYCLPPVAMTAYIVDESRARVERPRILLAHPAGVKRAFPQQGRALTAQTQVSEADGDAFLQPARVG